MGITHARAFGAGVGGRYGSFARAPIVRTVVRITQPGAHGAHVSRRYGTFDRAGVVRPDKLFTQLLAFGAHAGRRYGDFARSGGTPPPPPPPPAPSPVGPARIFVLPVDSEIEDDDVILLLASLPIASIPTNGGGSLQ